MMTDMPLLRPTYAAISLKALAFNLGKARAELNARGRENCKIMLLVKANAYGHGAELVSAFAQKEKLCDAFGVASIEEGIILRQKGVTLPILVLGSVYPFDCFEYALKYGLSVAVASVRAAKYITELSAKLKITAKCHVKQETGMGRIGSRRPAALEILKILNQGEYVKTEGTFSHFSSADGSEEYTRMQLGYFKDLLCEAAAQGLKVGSAHISASSGFLNYKDACFDMVRLGHLAYGLEEGYKPVLSLKSKIVFIKDVREGAAISYGRTFKCARPSKIATIPLGYGDGFQRVLSNKAKVLIHGRPCPLIGNITMDMLMADITELGDIPVGSEAVFIGRQGSEEITAAKVAAAAGTIDYEVLTSITARVPRKAED